MMSLEAVEAVEAASHAEFQQLKWPEGGARRNRATEPDRALIEYIEAAEREDPDFVDLYNEARTGGRCRYVRVKVRGKFRCHRCNHRWFSNQTWVSFDMRLKQVKRCWGQKCRDCRKFYSFPYPFFYTEEHEFWDHTTPWRDIVAKAVDLWLDRQDGFDNHHQLDGEADEEQQFNDEEVIDDLLESFHIGHGPHDEELCEMYNFMSRPCTSRPLYIG